MITVDPDPGPRFGRGTVLIVDDHSLITHGLSVVLRGEGLQTVSVADPDADGVVALAHEHRPVLALLDLQFGTGAPVGLSLIEPLQRLGTSSLVVTGAADPAVLGACLEAGAVGVVRKSAPFDHLLDRIEAALDGRPVNPVQERETLLAAARQRRLDDDHRLGPFRRLSGREQEVLQHLMDGVPAQAIAQRMCLALPTIRRHIQTIFQKLGVSSQLAAVAHARRAGWSLDAPS